MKCAIAILLVFFSISLHCGYSQTDWKKYPHNPVLSPGAQPTCLLENDTIKMWYIKVDNDYKARIHAAWSLNGINWKNYNAGNPVLDVGGTGEWDRGWIDAPEIVNGGEDYKLYYYGDTARKDLFAASSYDEITCAYGIATSGDGLQWEKYSENPVFSKGDSIKFDGKWVESPALYWKGEDSGYMMWYSGVGWNYLINNGLALSSSGWDWNRHAENPVTSVGPSGSYDDMWVAVPSVIHSNGIFEMWYSAFPGDGGFDSLSIAYAVSLNGIHWIKYPGNPVYDRYFSPYDKQIDSTGPWAPDVVYVPDSNKYFMWYDGTSGIQMASASRNVLNSANCNTSLTNDTTIHKGESLKIYAKGGTNYHWLPEEGLNNPHSASPTASPDSSVTYTVLMVSESCITKDTIRIKVKPTGTGDEIIANDNIKIYPNPASQYTLIDIEKGFYTPPFFISLIDSYGRTVRSVKTNRKTTRMKLSELIPGIYFIKFMDQNGVQKVKKLFVPRVIF